MEQSLVELDTWLQEHEKKWKQYWSQTERKTSFLSVDTTYAGADACILQTCLRELGWIEYPHGRRDGGLCDVYWFDRYSYCSTKSTTSINIYQGIDQLKKASVVRALNNLKKLFPHEYKFHPRSWVLGDDFTKLETYFESFESDHEKPIYVVKPSNGAGGRGIFIIDSVTEDLLSLQEEYVVQEYVKYPLLIDGYKWDIRIHMWLCIEPLHVLLHTEGVARFASAEYCKPSKDNIHQKYMHLTNSSVNRHCVDFKLTNSKDTGNARTLSSVLTQLSQRGYNISNVWPDIEELAVKTILAILPELQILNSCGQRHQDGNCYMRLGLDILLTENLQPVLMEVDNSPTTGFGVHMQTEDDNMKIFFNYCTYSVYAQSVKNLLKLVTQNTPLCTSHCPDNDNHPDNDLLTSGEDTSAYTCMKEIYPGKHADLYAYARIMEPLINIFSAFWKRRQGIKYHVGELQEFARRFKTGGLGMSSDELNGFIEICNNKEEMCFGQFVHTFVSTAMKLFPTKQLATAVRDLITYACNILPGKPQATPETT